MKKHSTLERLDLGREIRILALGLIGSLIMAINIKSFVHTGGLYPGGFNGVTLLIQTSFQRFLGISLPFSPISLALNAIPAIFSFRAIGKRFTLNTALIIVATSVFTDIVPAMPITQDILLISVFGGLINGAAISLCLIGGTSTGGTDFIAVYFLEKKNRDVWNFMLMGNATVLVLAGLLFGWDKALYSIIFQFTSTQMIHLLYQEHNKITLFIVTELPYEIYQEIMVTVHHSATEISATGMYSQEPKTMLYCVVSSTEAKIVTRKILEADPKALINVIKTETFKGRFHQTRHY